MRAAACRGETAASGDGDGDGGLVAGSGEEAPNGSTISEGEIGSEIEAGGAGGEDLGEEEGIGEEGLLAYSRTCVLISSLTYLQVRAWLTRRALARRTYLLTCVLAHFLPHFLTSSLTYR